MLTILAIFSASTFGASFLKNIGYQYDEHKYWIGIDIIQQGNVSLSLWRQLGWDTKDSEYYSGVYAPEIAYSFSLLDEHWKAGIRYHILLSWTRKTNHYSYVSSWPQLFIAWQKILLVNNQQNSWKVIITLGSAWSLKDDFNWFWPIVGIETKW